jgi:hypothetical protein
MRAEMNQHSRSVSLIGENSFTKSGSIRLETICTTDMVLSGHSKLLVEPVDEVSAAF